MSNDLTVIEKEYPDLYKLYTESRLGINGYADDMALAKLYADRLMQSVATSAESIARNYYNQDGSISPLYMYIPVESVKIDFLPELDEFRRLTCVAEPVRSNVYQLTLHMIEVPEFFSKVCDKAAFNYTSAKKAIDWSDKRRQRRRKDMFSRSYAFFDRDIDGKGLGRLVRVYLSASRLALRLNSGLPVVRSITTLPSGSPLLNLLIYVFIPSLSTCIDDRFTKVNYTAADRLRKTSNAIDSVMSQPGLESALCSEGYSSLYDYIKQLKAKCVLGSLVYSFIAAKYVFTFIEHIEALKEVWCFMPVEARKACYNICVNLLSLRKGSNTDIITANLIGDLRCITSCIKKDMVHEEVVEYNLSQIKDILNHMPLLCNNTSSGYNTVSARIIEAGDDVISPDKLLNGAVWIDKNMNAPYFTNPFAPIDIMDLVKAYV